MPPDGLRFVVIDGNSLAHRAFYALPLLANQEGQFTNAVYGFISMLNKVLAIENPDYLVVAFDKGKVNFRHERFAAYKEQRKPTPPELRPQFELIKRILAARRIPVFELKGYEADDLIGTLARQAEERGLKATIVTGDRDALQLVSGSTRVFLTKKGITNMEIYDLDHLRQTYGLEPRQLIDVKALMGDPSDNIPGVHGIGEKTALKLIQEYGSLERVMDNLELVKGAKIRETLAADREQAFLSRELATIVCDCPVELDLDACRHRDPDAEALLAIYRELGFKSLLGEIQAPAGGEPERAEAEVPVRCELIGGKEALARLAPALARTGAVALHFLFQGRDYRQANLAALGMAWSEGQYAVIPGPDLPEEVILDFCEPLWGEKQIYCYDAKAALVWLGARGVELHGFSGDPMLAAYLLNPTNNLELAYLAREYLAEETPDVTGNGGAAAAAGVTWRLYPVLMARLEQMAMADLYHQLEQPLERVLADMELVGVKVDIKQLEIMGVELAARLVKLTREIFDLTGEEFNLNSPKQLADMLFGKLGLPPGKKIKTGYSTDAEVLEGLAPHHPVVVKIMDYRQLMKLKSTYVDGLKPLVDPRTSKVHTSFNQTITATGRLSSTEPNLQNIPVRLELGRRIRKAFIPSTGDMVLLAADYSQIELRILAHFSGDEDLIQAFLCQEDIHARTAAEVFGVDLDRVTPEMRGRAKAVNFGIVYGISDFGLARDLDISRQEARDYIDFYFQRYPGVKRYLEGVIARAGELGYVTTILNRRRYLPDLQSKNRNVRSFGERTAVNTPIQGSAADIIKRAMLLVARDLKSRQLKAQMLLQVHDELILQVAGSDLDRVAALVKKSMETAVDLLVPLQVDVKVGPNWYDLQPYEADRGPAPE